MEKEEMQIEEMQIEPEGVIVIANSTYRALIGEYFIGQTNIITFGGGYYSWASLVNPENSHVNMYLNIYTISNYANIPLTAEGWLGSELSGKAKISNKFACGNQVMEEEPVPKVKIYNANFVQKTPIGGSYVFVNRVRPRAMFIAPEIGGVIIIPPGGSFSLFFLSSGKEQVQLKVAYGWWEEKIDDVQKNPGLL